MINTVSVNDMVSEESAVALNSHFDEMGAASRPPLQIQEIMPNLLSSFASNDPVFDPVQKHDATLDSTLG